MTKAKRPGQGLPRLVAERRLEDHDLAVLPARPRAPDGRDAGHLGRGRGGRRGPARPRAVPLRRGAGAGRGARRPVHPAEAGRAPRRYRLVTIPCIRRGSIVALSYVPVAVPGAQRAPTRVAPAAADRPGGGVGEPVDRPQSPLRADHAPARREPTAAPCPGPARPDTGRRTTGVLDSAPLMLRSMPSTVCSSWRTRRTSPLRSCTPSSARGTPSTRPTTGTRRHRGGRRATARHRDPRPRPARHGRARGLPAAARLRATRGRC